MEETPRRTVRTRYKQFIVNSLRLRVPCSNRRATGPQPVPSDCENVFSNPAVPRCCTQVPGRLAPVRRRLTPLSFTRRDGISSIFAVSKIFEVRVGGRQFGGSLPPVDVLWEDFAPPQRWIKRVICSRIKIVIRPKTAFLAILLPLIRLRQPTTRVHWARATIPRGEFAHLNGLRGLSCIQPCKEPVKFQFLARPRG